MEGQARARCRVARAAGHKVEALVRGWTGWVEHVVQLQKQNKGPIAVFFRQKTKPPWCYAVPCVSDLLKRLEAARRGAATKPAAAKAAAAACIFVLYS
jgi:hypothetical protein